MQTHSKQTFQGLKLQAKRDLLRDLTHQSVQAPFLCRMPANISSHPKRQWLQKFRFSRAKQTRQQLCLTALCQRFHAGHRSIRQHLPLRNHLQNLQRWVAIRKTQDLHSRNILKNSATSQSVGASRQRHFWAHFLLKSATTLRQSAVKTQ